MVNMLRSLFIHRAVLWDLSSVDLTSFCQHLQCSAGLDFVGKRLVQTGIYLLTHISV